MNMRKKDMKELVVLLTEELFNVDDLQEEVTAEDILSAVRGIKSELKDIKLKSLKADANNDTLSLEIERRDAKIKDLESMRASLYKTTNEQQAIINKQRKLINLCKYCGRYNLEFDFVGDKITFTTVDGTSFVVYSDQSWGVVGTEEHGQGCSISTVDIILKDDVGNEYWIYNGEFKR